MYGLGDALKTLFLEISLLCPILLYQSSQSFVYVVLISGGNRFQLLKQLGSPYRFSHIFGIKGNMSPVKQDFPSSTLALVVPQRLVKIVKDGLDRLRKLDKSMKIRPLEKQDNFHMETDSGPELGDSNWFIVPSTQIVEENSAEGCYKQLIQLLRSIGLERYTSQLSYHIMQPSNDGERAKDAQPMNIMGRVVNDLLLRLPSTLRETFFSQATFASNWSYTIYPPLLLFPSNTFSKEPWPALLTADLQTHREQLYTSICKAFKVTHIALNGPVPGTSFDSTPNILRSPTNLTPLYGDFGPSLPAPPEHEPTADDFDAAFWCSMTQNGIFQTWAPRYTMFSRGNLSEKTRVLHLESLTSDGLGGVEPKDVSAVDLYAGIGYFAFSYAKAGVGKVLCWEINGWSVEGLRRGANENRWKCKVVMDEQVCAHPEDISRIEVENFDLQGEQLIVFKESNHKARERIEALRSQIPPIRHVNCGFLPSSSGSWETAVRLLDPLQGGWIHAHENVNAKEIDMRKLELVETFRAIANNIGLSKSASCVVCEHVEVVKSYSPGIYHCVFDITVLPI